MHFCTICKNPFPSVSCILIHWFCKNSSKAPLPPCFSLVMKHIQGETENFGEKHKNNSTLQYIKLLEFWNVNKIIQWDTLMGTLSESLHLILVIKSFNEKGRRILGCPLVFFRILAEWEDDGINWHLHHCKEKSGNDITKTPAHLLKHE